VRRELAVASCQLQVASCQLAVASRQLQVGSCKSAVGSWTVAGKVVADFNLLLEINTNIL